MKTKNILLLIVIVVVIITFYYSYTGSQDQSAYVNEIKTERDRQGSLYADFTRVAV